MQRYEINTCEEYVRCNPLKASDDGDWVLYADVQKHIEELKAESAALYAQFIADHGGAASTGTIERLQSRVAELERQIDAIAMSIPAPSDLDER